MASVVSVNAKSVAVNSAILARSAKVEKGVDKSALKVDVKQVDVKQVDVKEVAVKLAEKVKEVAADAGFKVVAKNNAGDSLELSIAGEGKEPVAAKKVEAKAVAQVDAVAVKESALAQKAVEVKEAAPVKAVAVKESAPAKKAAELKEAADLKQVTKRADTVPNQKLVKKVEHAAEKLQDALANLLNSLQGLKKQPVNVKLAAPGKSAEAPKVAVPAEALKKLRLAEVAEPAAVAPGKKPRVLAVQPPQPTVTPTKQPPVSVAPQPTVTPTKQPPVSVSPQPVLTVEPVGKTPVSTTKPPVSVSPNGAAVPSSTTIVHNHYHVASPSAGGEAKDDSDALRGKLDKLTKRYEKLEKRFTNVIKNVTNAVQNNTQPPAQDVRSAVRLVQLGVLFAQRSSNDRSSVSAGLLNRLAQAFSTAKTAISSRSQTSPSLRFDPNSDDLAGADAQYGGSLDLSA